MSVMSSRGRLYNDPLYIAQTCAFCLKMGYLFACLNRLSSLYVKNLKMCFCANSKIVSLHLMRFGQRRWRD